MELTYVPKMADCKLDQSDLFSFYIINFCQDSPVDSILLAKLQIDRPAGVSDAQGSNLMILYLLR